MAYEKTVWKDHVVERPKTYRMVENADGTVTLVPVTGQVIQQGTALNAENLNHIEDTLAEHDEALGKRLPMAGGTMTGNINMGGMWVYGLSEPNNPSDAATKKYVDGKRVAYTAVLGTSWTGSGPYTQTVAVAGILASDMPHIMPVYDAANATAIAQKEAWSCVSKAEAAAGGIKFTCFEDKPGAAVPLQIEVVR